jgi:putative ABC transport system permease protein
MFSNYLKIALRNLVKNKLHSSINITGLALGMAAATLIPAEYPIWVEHRSVS